MKHSFIGDFCMKGFTKLDNNLLFSNELGVYQKLVLMGLTYFTRNGTGKCFCKKTTLASYLNLSLYQVRCGLVDLEDLGVINIQRVGQGNPDIITLTDLTASSQKISSTIHYREEEKEEEEDISNNNFDIDVKITPPPPQPHKNTDFPTSFDVYDVEPTKTPNHLTQVEERLHKSLGDVLRPHTYQTWFSEARVVSIDDDKLTIGFPLSQIQCGWIENNYLTLLTEVSNCIVQVVKLNGVSHGRKETDDG